MSGNQKVQLEFLQFFLIYSMHVLYMLLAVPNVNTQFYNWILNKF
jgi:hypothetical protein